MEEKRRWEVEKGDVFSRCHGRSGSKAKRRGTGRKDCKVVVGLLAEGSGCGHWGFDLRVYIGVALEVEVVRTWIVRCGLSVG